MSEILVDNLTGKTSAGDITVTSEGGAATQSLQQGLAKAWINLNGTAITSASDLTGVRDSFNVSTVVDTSTGNFTLSWSSTMDNANYSITGMTENFATSTTQGVILGVENGTLPTSSSVDLNTVRVGSTTLTEMNVNSASIHGDLA